MCGVELNDEYANEFLDRLEDWLAEMDTARRRLIDLELHVRALHSRGAIDDQELAGILDALEAIYIGNARGRQAGRLLRKYPPDFGHKYPLT